MGDRYWRFTWGREQEYEWIGEKEQIEVKKNAYDAFWGWWRWRMNTWWSHLNKEQYE